MFTPNSDVQHMKLPARKSVDDSLEDPETIACGPSVNELSDVSGSA